MTTPKIQNGIHAAGQPQTVSIQDVYYSGPKLAKSVNRLICVIDDDSHCRQLISQSLTLQDCDTLFVRTVDEFMSMSPLPDPDLLLLGVDVFDPDVLENVSRVRQSAGSAKTPLIFSMAYFMPGSFDHMLKQAGCNMCLRKSGDLEEVIAAVKKVSSQTAITIDSDDEMEASA